MKVRSLATTATDRVSHGRDIVKRVLLAAGEVPSLTNLSQATLSPGQVATGHVHADMWEIFLVVSGTGLITVDGQTVPLGPGMCVTVEPGEHHELANDSTGDLVVTYLGIAPDP